MNLTACKRVVLFNLTKDAETGEECIEFRHYGISCRQRAVNRSIKKLVNNNRVPDMSKFNDLADFIMHSRNKANAAFSSESEADDLPESRIVLPEDYQDRVGGSSVALKLHELGPRMKWQLVKIEEGFCRGNVVFHANIKRTKGEIKKQLDGLKSKRELKEKRKKEQEQNVKKKAVKTRGLKNQDGKEDDLVSDEEVVEGAEVDEGVQPGTAKLDAKGKAALGDPEKTRLFANFQKNRVVPNISSSSKRPAGFSKGLWKKELHAQLTGSYPKKNRRGMRTPSQKIDKDVAKSAVLGKRSAKTATTHKSNTSTFKKKQKKD